VTGPSDRGAAVLSVFHLAMLLSVVVVVVCVGVFVNEMLNGGALLLVGIVIGCIAPIGAASALGGEP
jgi:hypothetical protein